jgi:hypothetical protein
VRKTSSLLLILVLTTQNSLAAPQKGIRGLALMLYGALPIDNAGLKSASNYGELIAPDMSFKKHILGIRPTFHYLWFEAGYDLSKGSQTADDKPFNSFHQGPFVTVILPWVGGFTYTSLKADDELNGMKLAGSGYQIMWTYIFLPPTLIHLMYRKIDYENTQGASYDALMVGLSLGFGHDI